MNQARTLLFALLSLTTLIVNAQAPQAFSYQAVARDASGDPMMGQSVGVKFQIHRSTYPGTVEYAETHSTTTNDHGLFSLQVGNGTAGSGTFSAIDWRSGPSFLEVLLDPTNSGSFTSLGAQQLLSVPYALHSGSSSSVPDGTEVGQIMHWTGTAWEADSGLYVHQKRFGIGITEPASALGIAADTTNGSAITIYQASSSTGPGPFNPLAWNITVNPSNGDVAGFSIDDASSGIGTSRLFIADSTGNVGIGTTEPEAPLSIKSRSELYEEFQNGDIPDQNDFLFTTGGNTGFAIEEDTVGGTASRLMIQSGTGHVGVGSDDPPAPLSIESRDILKTYFETGDIPTQDNFGISTDSTGFDIGQGAPDALQSRLFIQATTGNIGIGTIEPDEKLHLENSSSNDLVGMRFRNTATTANAGWKLGHVQDSVPARDGAMMVFEDPWPQSGDQDFNDVSFMILPGGNVGINEGMPDTKLHVSRDLSDPAALVDLIEGTGIVVIGPMTNNVAMDYKGIQARTGTLAVGGSLTVEAGTLDLQRLGGDLLIHGGALIVSEQAILTSDAKLGLGNITPAEKIDIDGAIRLGTTANNNDGTVRYTGTDFEGRKGGAWVSLTAGSNVPNGTQTGQIMHWTGTTWAADSGLYVSDKRFGIGIDNPTYPLAIKAEAGGGLVELQPETSDANQSRVTLRMTPSDGLGAGGLSVEEVTTGGSQSRLFIQEGSGFVGIGTFMPEEKLHLEGSTASGMTGIKLLNTASVGNQGWRIGHLQDALTERDGSLLITSGSDEDQNDVVIRYNGNVGINEGIPDTKLHVSYTLLDPDPSTGFQLGTGLATIGPVSGKNISLDYQGIQARGVSVSGFEPLTSSSLHLQPLGGALLIHGGALTVSDQAILTNDAKLGLGTITPTEKLEVNGAIVIGNTATASPAPGSIRFNGTNFEAWSVGDWAIFNGTQWGKVDNTDHIFYDTGTTPRVGIGTSTPMATIHVFDSDASSGNTIRAAIIHNSSTTTSTGQDDHRIGLEVKNNGTWGGDALSKNIGLYVSEVSGQAASSSNLAAVFNGNVVIGDVTGQMVGTGGTKVLAIQNGAPPTDALSGGPGSPGGIQIYSDVDLTGVSTIHVMNGNGDVIKLYKETALTLAENLPVDNVYDPAEAAVINNLRTRLNELESKLQAMGLLP